MTPSETRSLLSAVFFALVLLPAGCSNSRSDGPAGGDGAGPMADRQAGDGDSDHRGSDGAVAPACSAGPELLARVDAARMLADLNALAAIGDRSSWAGQNKAAEYLKTQLSPLGLQVRTPSYTYVTSTFVNVEATLPGELADKFVFVGAHYDAVKGSPGADDDGSGTVAVLELARALAGCKPKRSVRFLFFSNEEKGTVGSTQYVQSIAAAVPPPDLIGFLSLDMIGYAHPGEDLDIATRPAYSALADQVAASVGTNASLPVKKVVDDHCG